MGRTPQAGDAGGDTGERVGARRTGDPHRRGRGVLLVVGVQREDLVERARQHRVDDVFLARRRKAHPQEVGGIAQRVLRIHERLTDRIFVGHRRQRRDLGDHADRSDHPLGRIVDVGGVVIERRERADRRHHHRHRMGVAAERLEEPRHLLMHHVVARDAIVEVFLLRLGRQLAVQQQITGLEEVALFGELVDRVAAILQHAGIAIDIGDLGLAARRRGETRVVGEVAGLGIQLADVDDIWAHGAAQYREIVALATDRERCGFGVCCCVHRVVPDVIMADTSGLPTTVMTERGTSASYAVSCVAHCTVHCKTDATSNGRGLFRGLVGKPRQAFLAAQHR